jgi:uncharacterized protein YjbI with pentapeptide repeats
MANQDQVVVLRQGACAWNSWRRLNPVGNPDLAEADLMDADLTDADLTGADLTNANLTNASLTNANLTDANLTDAGLADAGLTRAALTGANLTGADLTCANLMGADLTYANLTNAHLRAANVTGANLTDADLTGANLTDANLTDANLTNAKLEDAGLTRANLTRANLTDADFLDATFLRTHLDRTVLTGSIWGDTFLASVKLSDAIGLEAISHVGPSFVTTDTLLLSEGKLPHVLLRGCGLSDWEIEAARLYDPSLSAHQISDIQYRVFELRAGASIQIGSLFISYNQGDSDFVAALEKKLDETGVRYWRDVHHAPAGRLDKIIDRAMRLNPTVLLILSKNSVESDWVEDEATRARELEKELRHDVLCPIALDDSWEQCNWSRPLRTQIKKYNVLRFDDWENPTAMTERFSRLVEGLSIFYRSAAGSA